MISAASPPKSSTYELIISLPRTGDKYAKNAEKRAWFFGAGRREGFTEPNIVGAAEKVFFPFQVLIIPHASGRRRLHADKNISLPPGASTGDSHLASDCHLVLKATSQVTLVISPLLR